MKPSLSAETRTTHTDKPHSLCCLQPPHNACFMRGLCQAVSPRPHYPTKPARWRRRMALCQNRSMAKVRPDNGGSLWSTQLYSIKAPSETLFVSAWHHCHVFIKMQLLHHRCFLFTQQPLQSLLFLTMVLTYQSWISVKASTHRNHSHAARLQRRANFMDVSSSGV